MAAELSVWHTESPMVESADVPGAIGAAADARSRRRVDC